MEESVKGGGSKKKSKGSAYLGYSYRLLDGYSPSLTQLPCRPHVLKQVNVNLDCYHGSTYRKVVTMVTPYTLPCSTLPALPAVWASQTSSQPGNHGNTHDTHGVAAGVARGVETPHHHEDHLEDEESCDKPPQPTQTVL